MEPAEDNHLCPIDRLRLWAYIRRAARAWRQNGVTEQDIIQVYGESPEERGKWFKDVGIKHE